MTRTTDKDMILIFSENILNKEGVSNYSGEKRNLIFNYHGLTKKYENGEGVINK